MAVAVDGGKSDCEHLPHHRHGGRTQSLPTWGTWKWIVSELLNIMVALLCKD